MTDTSPSIIGATDIEEFGLSAGAAHDLVHPPAARVRRRRRMPFSVKLAIAWLALVIVSAIFANLLPIADWGVDVGHGVRTPPFQSFAEPLGTDSFGRSVLSRIIYGGRVSLLAGIVSVLIALVLGLIVGLTAGYLRGKVDGAVGIVIDSLLSFPGLILLLALAATMQPGLSAIIVGLSILSFPTFARLTRANTLQYSSAEFVLASRGLGARAPTVLFREVLPLVLSSLFAFAAVVAAALILAESALSFLGLGVPTPKPSWGNMIADGRTYLQDAPQLVFVPVTILFLTIFSMNVIGDWLRSRSTGHAVQI